jgi:hypothetical protein
VTDQVALRRLSHDLVLFAADDDELGLQGALWALTQLGEVDRAIAWARADGVGARALRQLAFEWDVTPAEALARLTGT